MQRILSSSMRIMPNLPCLNVRTPGLSLYLNHFKTDHELAHPNQKELITSLNSTLTDEECETAAKELRRLAGVEGFGKFMDENNLNLIVTNSDCSLVSFKACSGKLCFLMDRRHEQDGPNVDRISSPTSQSREWPLVRIILDRKSE
jgi:hypothetical protein